MIKREFDNFENFDNSQFLRKKVNNKLHQLLPDVKDEGSRI